MTVSGVLMAHKKREQWAEELSETLELPIVWDRINDRHETGLRCLQAGLESDASHWLIVQDDAIVCRDLLAGLEKAVEVSGDRMVGLYVGNTGSKMKTLMQNARATKRSWVSAAGPSWGVGIIIPTVHLPVLTRAYERSRETNYDRRIEKWAAQAQVECWYTAPSLVDHRIGAENPSLVPGRSSTSRQARWFIGAEASALDIDWTRAPIGRDGITMWRNRRTGRTVRTRPGSPQASRMTVSDVWEPVRQTNCGECGTRRFVLVDDEMAV